MLRSNKEARKRLTESNGTPAMDLGHMNVVGNSVWMTRYWGIVTVPGPVISKKKQNFIFFIFLISYSVLPPSGLIKWGERKCRCLYAPTCSPCFRRPAPVLADVYSLCMRRLSTSVFSCVRWPAFVVCIFFHVSSKPSGFKSPQKMATMEHICDDICIKIMKFPLCSHDSMHARACAHVTHLCKK